MAKIRLIDLGLPSGTMWGDRNLGADAPEVQGDYVAWGGTHPHEDGEGYFLKNYEFYKEVKESHEEEITVYPTQYEEIEVEDPITKETVKMYRALGHGDLEPMPLPEGCTYDPQTMYIVDPENPWSYEPHQEIQIVTESHWEIVKYNDKDGKTVLDAEDDAATAAFGSEFCLPSKEQWKELFENTKMVVEDGVAVFTAPNGHSIAFPLVGCFHESQICHDVLGEYWTKDSVDTDNAYRTMFSASLDPIVCSQWKIIGMQIRAVMK